MHSSSRGFTLIELLVVIAIIGLLASVVVASLTRARIKGRDTRRVQDLRTIQTAIEMYASDHNHYPITATWASFDAPSYIGTDVTNPNATDITAALAPYLPKPPTDPTPGATDDGYLYRGDGTQYCILFHKAPEDMRNFETNLIPMSRCGSIGANGQCTGTNAIYIGTGTYATGC